MSVVPVRRPSTTDKESRAFTVEVTGIPAKSLRKVPSVFFLAPYLGPPDSAVKVLYASILQQTASREDDEF